MGMRSRTRSGSCAIAADWRFSSRKPNDPSAIHSTLADVEDVAWCLPAGKVRSTLLAILRSPNSMAHLVQSISFT
jgi:hypothetical protein